MRTSQRLKSAKIANAKGFANCSLRPLSIQIRRISVAKVDKSTESNGSVSLDIVEKWKHEIYDHLNKTNRSGILKDCNRVFIMTDVDFLFDPASSFVTTLVLIGASGSLAPPIVFFPNNESTPRYIFDIETNGTKDLPRHKTDTNDNLLNYMRYTFHPWLTSSGSEFPVIIFIDIDPVHISWSALSFCTKNQIILLSMIPGIPLHPIRSFVLPHLKNEWSNELIEWTKKNNDQPIAIESVPLILRQVFEKTITVDLLTSAFQKCGMFPFDPVNVFGTMPSCCSSSPQTLNIITEPVNTTQSTSQPVTKEMEQPTVEVSHSTPQCTQGTVYDSEASESGSIVNSTSASITPETTDPTDQFQVLFGPLSYEFIKAGKYWNGALENTSLFEVWQRLLNSHHQHPIERTIPSTAQDINQQFRLQFEAVIGPLMYEFKNSGNVWTGATENTALFEVWKHLLNLLDTDVSMQVS